MSDMPKRIWVQDPKWGGTLTYMDQAHLATEEDTEYLRLDFVLSVLLREMYDLYLEKAATFEIVPATWDEFVGDKLPPEEQP